MQDTMKCVNCDPQRPQILSQTLLHLRFRSWQWQMNVWKGTLRVDGGGAALPEADRVICQTEKAVNLLHSLSYPHTCTHAHTHLLPLQCMQRDPDLMELE